MNSVECAELFLCKTDIEVNSRDSNNLTPLMYACRYKSVKCGELLLLQRETVIDVQSSSDGRTALHWACHENSSKLVVAILRNQNATPQFINIKNNDGETALDITK